MNPPFQRLVSIRTRPQEAMEGIWGCSSASTPLPHHPSLAPLLLSRRAVESKVDRESLKNKAPTLLLVSQQS
jgi:hypothetical protein